MSEINIKGLKVNQGNYQFILQKITVEDLMKFTRFTERILMSLDEENRPIYNDFFQRKLDMNKVNKIADFLIDDPNSIFPTNIVLAVPEEAIQDFEEDNESISFQIRPWVIDDLSRNVYITIVDGQHRIRGIEVALNRLNSDLQRLYQIQENSTNQELKRKFERFTEARLKLLSFELIVTYAINATIDFQASIFSIINRTQTKVSENLVQSLFGLIDKESPQKTSLEITLALNSHPTSPFFKRIKLFGHNRNVIAEKPVITQSSFVKAILRLISSSSREAERDRFKPRRELLAGIIPSLCFRKYYAKGEDQKIINILFAYFKSIETTLKDQHGESLWELNPLREVNLLQTTVGFESLLAVLPQILVQINEDERENVITYNRFVERFAGINFTDIATYPLASVGKTRLKESLLEALN